MLAFPSVPSPANTCGTRHKATVSSRKSPFFFESQDSTNWLFSNPPKPIAHASGAWRHSHPLVNLSLGFLFWHLWTTHPLRACVNTSAQVCAQITNMLSRKVLSLTKPKGKIYKTKSLGHYITIITLSITKSFKWFQLRKGLNIYIWPIDGTQTSITTPGQRRPGSNGYEGVHNILRSSRTWASISDSLVSNLGPSLARGVVLPLCRDAVDVFYNWEKTEKMDSYFS